MASKKVRVDFTGVESFNRASEGQHVAKIVSAELKASQGGNDMIVVAFEVTKGSDKGSRVYENYPLSDTALWKLKGMLQAIGMKCDGKVQLDLDKLVGKVCIIEVIHEEYDGKTRAKIQECRKLAAAAEEDVDDDEVEDDIDDEEEEEEEEAPKKKASSKKKESKSTSKEKAPMNPPEDEDDEDDEDWDEDDEEEEEEAPKKKVAKKSEPAKKAPAKKASKKKKSEPEDDDDDDDDDWDEE